MLEVGGVGILGREHLPAELAGTGFDCLLAPPLATAGLSCFDALFAGPLGDAVLVIPIFSRLGVGVATFAAGDFFR